MKIKSIFILIAFCFFLQSCSFIGVFDNEITEEQKKYIHDIVLCDLKSTDYTLNNTEGLMEFFDGEGTESFVLNYAYPYGDIEKERSIHITRLEINDTMYYISDFDRFTFPGSDCNNLKNKTKSF